MVLKKRILSLQLLILQSLSNKNRYISQGFKKAANIEILKEIFSVMDAKGIKLESCPTNITGNKSIQSGEVVLKTVDGKINFLWVKGHSSNGGNDKADKLATDARKQLDKDLKHSVDAVVAEVVLQRCWRHSQPEVQSLACVHGGS